MGIDTRRPPLPAPTDTTSMDDSSPVATEVATNVTTRTDKTSYTIPEDGSPVVISTKKREGRIGHGRQKSQTSLLIEYFEGSRSGDKIKGRPSVRVKVTPSSRKSSAHRANDAVHITSIGSDRKPSYTRRIPLSSKNVQTAVLDGTEVSHSSESNLSARPPVEIEVLNHNESDISNSRSSRGLLYAHNDSNVSSMPPDSMLDGSVDYARGSEVYDEDEENTITKENHLQAPQRRRSRSTSRERLTQKVMEKLGQTPTKHRKSTHTSRERHTAKENEGYERRRRSSKSHHEDDTVSGAESSLLSSNITPSQRSYRSNVSQSSRVTNNPRLLEMVEDTIKRIVLPEINAIKHDQRADRHLRSLDSSRRGSLKDVDYDHSLERRVSKSSSSPNISSRPKVVLNRDGDDPGTVLSRGDSEYRKVRKSSGERTSSRKSSGHRKSESYDEDVVRSRSGKSKDHAKLAAAGIAGGILTAAALKHHDSQTDMHERRKRRSKSRSSRSRSNSYTEATEEMYTRKEHIPPMPMASHINESDLTRDSLLSTDNDAYESTEKVNVQGRTPIREVSRGSLNTGMSPVSSRTPTRTPVSKELGMSHTNHLIESPSSIKTRTAALAAAGLGAAAATHAFQEHERHVDADGYGGTTPKRTSASPAQSVSSLRKQYEDPLIPAGLRPHSAASRSSAGRLREKASLNSAASSPVTKLSRSRDRSVDEFATPLERPQHNFTREGTQTPNGEEVEEWFNRQHLQNEKYRESLDTAGQRTSYQTNPYPEDEKSYSQHSDTTSEQGVHGLGANPRYVHAPHGVESAVASLMEPSTLSSGNPISTVDSPARASYSDRMAEHLHTMGKDEAVIYDGSTLSERMPSDDRWTVLKSQARTLSGSTSRDHVDAVASPRQSPAKSMRSVDNIESPVKLGASGLPIADDPMPEIGHFDDTKSEVSTNPSIIKGPLSGDVTGKETWPYTPSPHLQETKSRESNAGHGKDILAGAALAGGAAAALAAAKARRQPSIEDDYSEDGKFTPDLGLYNEDPIDRNTTPTPNSPAAALRDEGYVTDAHASADATTPKADRQYNRRDIDAYHQAMDEQDFGEDDDVFTTNAKHARHLSGNSHGIASPIYDSATGKGMDNIHSKDIVALMDHLTVRDAHRNARDTEILVTLVRHATEMRQNFEEMKRFIFEQDKLIMSNTDRANEQTVQKVLGGPRPQPTGSPRTPRKQSEEDIQLKRKGVLRRALKGLTGGRSSNDLVKIEDMLMQVLDNVEELKHQGVPPRQTTSSYMDDSMDSYEKLRAAPDSGYEPEGAAGTNSTPSQSGHFAMPSRNDKQVFHSGYNGRPGSENRVSTVLEGDEDEDLEPHERNVLDHQFENNERMLTPTQEVRGRGSMSSAGTPPHQAATYYSPRANETTPKAAEKQRKHKSNTSIFGVGAPKTSRWSKTTASSAVPDHHTLDSPDMAKNARPISAASRSGSDIHKYDDDRYSLRDDDRLRSTQSLAREQEKVETRSMRSMRSQASRITRTPSPLIPSEASYRHDEHDGGAREHDVSPIQQDDYDAEFEDAKYHSIRNSILLQHPQPRQGPTNRHQDHLETKAQSYPDVSTTGSDVSQRTVSDFDPAMWGSTGAAALNKNRFSQAEPLSPVSMGSPYAKQVKDDGPLVPSAKQQQQQQHRQPVQQSQTKYDEYDDDDDDDDEDDDEDWEPQYSKSGFAKNSRPWYSSPLGSGHLLEPIEEVRYSLETDSGHISPEPQVASARAVDMRSTARKITGPRPMGSRNASGAKPREVETSGTVRRKPARGSQPSNDSLTSNGSDTF